MRIDPNLHNCHRLDGFITSTVTRFLPIQACVAVKIGDTVQIRDTKLKDSPTLTFTKAEWRAFIQGVKQNEFEV